MCRDVTGLSISRKTFLWSCCYILKTNTFLGFFGASDTHKHLEDLMWSTHISLCPTLCRNLGQTLGTLTGHKSEPVNS